MPLLEPPRPLSNSPTSESSTGAHSLSQSTFPLGSLHPTFSGLTLTVHQRPIHFTEEELDGGPLLQIRFHDPAGCDSEGKIETSSNLSLGEEIEVLGVISLQCVEENRRRVPSAREILLYKLHDEIVQICRDATVEDYNTSKSPLLHQVTDFVWRVARETKLSYHLDDVGRLIYAICQVMPVQLHELDLRWLLVRARVDSAPYRS
jgi:hypothetical protein